MAVHDWFSSRLYEMLQDTPCAHRTWRLRLALCATCSVYLLIKISLLMSQNNKRTLWQKIKQFFESESAPKTEGDGATATKADETDAINTSEPTTAVEEESQTATASATPPTTEHETPITDQLKRYFEKQEWQYSEYGAKADDTQQTTHLSLRMRHKDIECGYLFRIQERHGLLAVYGILPFTIPESHKSAALLLLTQINYDMVLGNLEMDVSDGEIRYKNALDIEVVGISPQIIDHLLQSVVAMTTVAYEVFSDLLNTSAPASDMETLLQELQQEADARTFFLPTDSVQ